MIKDNDLDIMNILKSFDENQTAFYFRSCMDECDGFYYYVGTMKEMVEGMADLMEQDEVVRDIIIQAASLYLE